VPVTLLHTSSPPPHGAAREPAGRYFASLGAGGGGPPARVGVLAPADSRLWAHVRDAEGVVWVPFELGELADPAVTAQRLFDGLLTLEGEGVDAIVVEEVSEEREGLAIMNRVKKAAGKSRWIDLSSSP
jgi:L-threonylcarbamoyladenylate synthase